MFNIYQPYSAKITAVRDESADTKLFRLVFCDSQHQRDFAFEYGQFVQIGLPGWGECPISICSSPYQAKNYFELAVRDVGVLTHQLSQLSVGDAVDIRGPFGNGFEIDNFKDRPLILIGGGCGFVPLRPLINDYLEGKLDNTVLQIFYGCRNEDTLLFKKEYANWRRLAELNIILEKPSPKWSGDKGLITDLFAKNKITANSAAVLVGPPVMYRFAIEALKSRRLKDENIFVSLERRMYCGIGVCQHCAIGPYYVCKDGPVFCWQDIKDIRGII